jgi:hypothetical protein
MSVWWQTIQYVCIGVSELLAVAGSLELFYSQAPDAMRSFCSALQVVCMGLGSYVAAALVAILQAISTAGGGPGWIATNVNQAHLDYFFWTLLVLMFLDFLLFLRVSSRFRYRELPHATVGVEALALTPDLKSGVGLTIAMSAKSRMALDLRSGMLRPATLHHAISKGTLSARSNLILRRATVQASEALTLDATSSSLVTEAGSRASHLQTATA